MNTSRSFLLISTCITLSTLACDVPDDFDEQAELEFDAESPSSDRPVPPTLSESGLDELASPETPTQTTTTEFYAMPDPEYGIDSITFYDDNGNEQHLQWDSFDGGDQADSLDFEPVYFDICNGAALNRYIDLGVYEDLGYSDPIYQERIGLTANTCTRFTSRTVDLMQTLYGEDLLSFSLEYEDAEINDTQRFCSYYNNHLIHLESGGHYLAETSHANIEGVPVDDDAYTLEQTRFEVQCIHVTHDDKTTDLRVTMRNEDTGRAFKVSGNCSGNGLSSSSRIYGSNKFQIERYGDDWGLLGQCGQYVAISSDEGGVDGTAPAQAEDTLDASSSFRIISAGDTAPAYTGETLLRHVVQGGLTTELHGSGMLARYALDMDAALNSSEAGGWGGNAQIPQPGPSFYDRCNSTVLARSTELTFYDELDWVGNAYTQTVLLPPLACVRVRRDFEDEFSGEAQSWEHELDYDELRGMSDGEEFCSRYAGARVRLKNPTEGHYLNQNGVSMEANTNVGSEFDVSCRQQDGDFVALFHATRWLKASGDTGVSTSGYAYGSALWTVDRYIPPVSQGEDPDFGQWVFVSPLGNYLSVDHSEDGNVLDVIQGGWSKFNATFEVEFISYH